MTAYAGVDYSLGQSNVNRETGIHYGVISQHSIMPEAMDDFENDYGEATCPECNGKLTASENLDIDTEIGRELYDMGKDYACLTCKEVFWSDVCFVEEALSFNYDRGGYKLTNCLDSDVFVLESPFYTFAQYCSPCVPGAGNLDTPCEGGAKTYALGHDWFEKRKAPYPVYKVEDGSLVEPETES